MYVCVYVCGCGSQFNPELVLVSSGLDAARGDPLVSDDITMTSHVTQVPFLCSQGGYGITPAGYAHMTHLLCGLAGGKMVIALEVSRLPHPSSNDVPLLHREGTT